jgi:alpha-glucosidase
MRFAQLRYWFITILFLVLAASGLAQTKRPAAPPRDAEGHEWWRHAVFYELYPRSFADSNNDGIGDLNGITSKMEYLQKLGIDAIWITPCFPSPQVDFGYDVSDYKNIDPMYGTLQDFDRMVTAGHQHNVNIILDFVVNHTSDKHQWFIESKSSKTSPKRDWYVWRDGRDPREPDVPPNDWVSTFGGPAWTLDEKTGQFYYHYFYVQQPDLNWRNPQVREAMLDVPRFWYQRGVMGFRLDAVDTLFEDAKLRNNPVLPGKNSYGDPEEYRLYNTHLPEVHDSLRDIRRVSDEFGAVLIGETWTETFRELVRYYGRNNDELQMPMDFKFTEVKTLSPADFRREIALIEGTGEWPVYVLSNHDIKRQITRYGDGQNNDKIAKMLAAMLLTLRGTPVMYYGEELGMVNNDPTRKEDVKDPIGKIGWPEQKGRDGERTPMQWNTGANAGFTTATPWLPVPPSYTTHNVETEDKDPNSILNFYRQLIQLRRTNPILHEGSQVLLNEQDPNVLSYVRRYKNGAVLVALNMTGAPRSVSFDLSRVGVKSASGKVLLSTEGNGNDVNLQQLSLPPFAAYVVEVSQ